MPTYAIDADSLWRICEELELCPTCSDGDISLVGISELRALAYQHATLCLHGRGETYWREVG